jgi:hypothetical protein
MEEMQFHKKEKRSKLEERLKKRKTRKEVILADLFRMNTVLMDANRQTRRSMWMAALHRRLLLLRLVLSQPKVLGKMQLQHPTRNDSLGLQACR